MDHLWTVANLMPNWTEFLIHGLYVFVIYTFALEGKKLS